jgi:hypothetical protein
MMRVAPMPRATYISSERELQETIMQTVKLTIPELLFVVGTRAMLAAGVALLVFRNMRDRDRKILGTALAIAGAISTVPAAMAVISSLKRDRFAVPDELPGAE